VSIEREEAYQLHNSVGTSSNHSLHFGAHVAAAVALLGTFARRS
jgi:hypothetical protein